MSKRPTPQPEPTPFGGVALSGADCPKCGAFLTFQLVLAGSPPPARPAGPGSPCTICPSCREPLWVILSQRARLARPAQSATTALIPRERIANRKGYSETRIMYLERPGEESGPQEAIHDDSDIPMT